MVKHSTILFDKKPRASHGRLHVGYRFSDWSKVWYQPTPDAQADSDGTIGASLFRFANGPPQKREPMMGTVSWLPHFDVTIRHCESNKASERERMHLQFLHDAWLYMNEDSPDQLRELEESLDQERDPKWQSWFKEAKKYKERRKRGHAKNVVARTNAVRAAGLDPAEIDIPGDSSDDSAYQTDADRSRLFVKDTSMRPTAATDSGVQRGSFGSMAANTSQPSGGKRRNVGGGPKNGPKKQKPTPTTNSRAVRKAAESAVDNDDDNADDDDDDEEDYTMSGGSNVLGAEARRTSAGGAGGRARLFGQKLFSDDFGSRPLNGALSRGSHNEDAASQSSRASGPFDASSPVPFPRGGSVSKNGTPGVSSGETGILPTAEPSGLDDAAAQKVNGGLGEDAAVQRAVRESTAALEQGRAQHSSGGQGIGQSGENGHEG